ncbi:choice-of-anchor I family protein [Roseomonas rosulenta]|uniref:choice-of-anchor I family protein n=1 Tax=Roseomonas rosulenta TaxID=2748667 RepID=UPI0018DF39DB|nr:choice-of-anchor I family protein [Roseomonas rosulenta]
MSGTQLSATTAFTLAHTAANGSSALDAEVAAYDAGTGLIFVIGADGVDAVDAATGIILGSLDTSLLGNVNSVAVKDGVVALAIESEPKTDPGKVVVADLARVGDTVTLIPRDFGGLGFVTVGAQPDQIGFTPDGTRLLTANEGEPNSYGQPTSVDPVGSVSIIDVATGAVSTADFTSFNGQIDALRAAGVRIFGPGATVAQDLEPEYVAVDPNDPTKAYVTLQEANAIAVLDLTTATFTKIIPLGFKDHGLAVNAISGNDNDNVFAPVTFNNLSGMYQPDGIAAVDFGGTTYLITANEGDARTDWPGLNEESRISALRLDPTAFPDDPADADTTPEIVESLGRLTVTNRLGDTDGDGDFDQLYVFGGRSFSVWNTDGTLVFDSGNLLDEIIATRFPGSYDENRDDNKGVEPESITIGKVGDDTFIFVSLERADGVAAFRMDAPDDFTFAGFFTTPGDDAPEVITFVPAEDAPGGAALLVVPNEDSATTTAYELEATFTLQLLHASDFEGGVEATQRAKNFAAIVDVLEDEFANSITLSSGDNFIPGAFTAAGTDPSVRDEIASFYEQLFGLSAGSLTGIRNGTLPFNAADMAILNAIGVQASVLGNHDFDLGPSALASAFDFTATLPGLPGQPGLGSISNIGAQFPYLSANLNFAAERALSGLYTPDLRDASSYATTAADLASGAAIRAEATGRELSRWTTIQEGGETIGVLGVTTQLLASISTVGNVTVADPSGDGGADNMAELAAIIQPLVDQMTAQGINKIVLLSHLQQFGNELALAPLLRDVDILIGGGSNTLLADATDPLAPGDTADGTYPVAITNAGGTTTLVVNTDGNYNYVGRLVVTFDAAGNVIPGSAAPAVSGAFVTTDAGVDAVAGDGDGTLSQAERDAIFADGTRGGEVKQITDAIADVIDLKDGNVLGYTEVFLEGRRNEVRTEETNLGSLTADANLAAAREYQAAHGGAEPLPVLVSIKNGGGIRAEIGAVLGQPIPAELPPQPDGAISQLDIENSLRFNNQLSLITLDAANLVTLVENALRSVAPGATPGSFPQIAGLRFSFDATRPAGDRVVSLAVLDADGEIADILVRDGQLEGDPTRDFRIVTLNFLAAGGDNYLGTADAVVGNEVTVQDRVDMVDPLAAASGGATFAADYTEQDALAEYLLDIHGTPDRAFDVADTTPAGDTRIQNLAARGDTVLKGIVLDGAGLVEGTGGDDVLDGRVGADTLLGGTGNDSLRGGFGDDSIAGGNGADTIDAGPGNNRVDAGEGNDSVVASSGRDTILGGAGADTIRGGFNDDVLAGDDGNDLVLGEGGLDLITGGKGDDTLDGGLRDDTIDGGEGNDLVLGGVGRDSLSGGAGNDTVEGGLGIDTIEGGAGDDLLIGGSGLDRFIFGTGSGHDTILGYQPGERLVLEDGLGLTSRSAFDADLDGADDLLLTFSDGGSVTLIDVTRLTVFAVEFA